MFRASPLRRHLCISPPCSRPDSINGPGSRGVLLRLRDASRLTAYHAYTCSHRRVSCSFQPCRVCRWDAPTTPPHLGTFVFGALTLRRCDETFDVLHRRTLGVSVAPKAGS